MLFVRTSSEHALSESSKTVRETFMSVMKLHNLRDKYPFTLTQKHSDSNKLHIYLTISSAFALVSIVIYDNSQVCFLYLMHV